MKRYSRNYREADIEAALAWMDEHKPTSLADRIAEGATLPPELIEGILRRSHKLLIAGPSKAGKSFLLMELCIAIAEGLPWLGFPCRKGRVLYVNLEIDPSSCICRFLNIYKVLGLSNTHMNDILIWSLRGSAKPMDELVPPLVQLARDNHLDAVILDPIYKVITGSENSATDMAAFTNNFDRICQETGAAFICSHHHSKGAQGHKKAQDRFSGSGVFARDPDALLDMTPLELSQEIKARAKEGAAAFRVESSLREFRNITPLNIWFEYPIHRVDTEGELDDMPVEGTSEAGRVKSKYHKTTEEAESQFFRAFEQHQTPEGYVTVTDMMNALGLKNKAVYARVKKMDGAFVLKKGKIYRADACGEENSTDEEKQDGGK